MPDQNYVCIVDIFAELDAVRALRRSFIAFAALSIDVEDRIMVDYLDVPLSTGCTASTRLARMYHCLSVQYELQVFSADPSIQLIEVPLLYNYLLSF
jgi:hypothetical protein